MSERPARTRNAEVISPAAAYVLLALEKTPGGAKAGDVAALTPRHYNMVKVALTQLTELGAVTFTGNRHRHYFLSPEGRELLVLAEEIVKNDAKRPARRPSAARDALSKEDAPDPLKAKWLYAAW